jgi:hypothetical protein
LEWCQEGHSEECLGKVVLEINEAVQGEINDVELAAVVRFQVAPTVKSMK